MVQPSRGESYIKSLTLTAQTIKGLDNVAVTVYLQPTPFTSEVSAMLDERTTADNQLALKRFYRHSLQYGPNFDVDG